MRQVADKKGLNLIEVMLAIVIFATAVPAIGYVFGTAFKQEFENSQHTVAVNLASALMDEISTRAFYESAMAKGNCSDAGELNGYDRRAFNDIDDYTIFSKDCGATTAWGALSPPRDEAGNLLSDFSKFSQFVQVYNIKTPTAGPTARTDYAVEADGTTDFKMVIVTISWDGGKNSVKLYKVFALHS